MTIEANQATLVEINPSQIPLTRHTPLALSGTATQVLPHSPYV